MKRRTIDLSFALAAVVLALAACGSTTTIPATSSGAPTASGAPAASASPPTAEEFKAYVDAVKPVIVKWQTAGKVLRATLSGLHPKPNNSWDTAAIDVTQQGVFLRQASDALAKVTPPPAFAETNKQAVQSLLLQADAIRTIGSFLASRQFKPGAIDRSLTSQLNRSGVRQLAWINALNIQASALGMPMPWPIKK
jgi:membrane-bound lytic murein transglycosylase B